VSDFSLLAPPQFGQRTFGTMLRKALLPAQTVSYLLQNNSDAYLANYNGNSTELYHGHIGKFIAKIADEGLVSRIGDSWSLNIHKTFSECACWQKK
jgi:hypothetical protein